MKGIMKPFSLEEYIKNPSRKIVTRDGRNVRIICTNAKGNFPIIALVETHNDTEVVLRLREDGCFYNTTEDSRDIFFVTEKQEGWINIFRGKDGPIITGYMFVSKEAAEESSRHCNGFIQGLYLATVKVEWEE